MTPSANMLTLTLHWQADGLAHEATVACEDSPPSRLLPILARGCGLAPDARGYRLYGGAGGRAPLEPERPLSAQGLSSGSHLWLLADSERPRAEQARCLLTIADGVDLAIPRAGMSLTRGLLLRVLELLAPEAARRELEQLERRSSPYRFISNRAHCRIAYHERSGWALSTDRGDVSTSLNGARLRPNSPVALQHLDQLRIGDGGPVFRVAIL